MKKAILHRKNALFYKTLNGARVGDVFMSLIHTAELNGIAPFDYLVALQRHHQDVARDPERVAAVELRGDADGAPGPAESAGLSGAGRAQPPAPAASDLPS